MKHIEGDAFDDTKLHNWIKERISKGEALDVDYVCPTIKRRINRRQLLN